MATFCVAYRLLLIACCCIKTSALGLACAYRLLLLSLIAYAGLVLRVTCCLLETLGLHMTTATSSHEDLVSWLLIACCYEILCVLSFLLSIILSLFDGNSMLRVNNLLC